MDNQPQLSFLSAEQLYARLNQSSNFGGNKIGHIFEMKTVEETCQKTVFNKKTGKSFTKTWLVKGQVYDEKSHILTPEILDKDTRFELKHDGSCGYLKFNEQTGVFTVYARYDVRLDEKTSEWKAVGKDWISCGPEPEKNLKNHWPHFRPCSEDERGYQWFIEAFEKLKTTGFLNNIKHSFTFELMGDKVQRCNADLIGENSVIIPHGCITLTNFPPSQRTYEGFQKLFQQLDYIEGVVAYCSNGETYKIRRDMFVESDGKRMKWPTDLNQGTSLRVWNIIKKVDN